MQVLVGCITYYQSLEVTFKNIKVTKIIISNKLSEFFNLDFFVHVLNHLSQQLFYKRKSYHNLVRDTNNWINKEDINNQPLP